METNKEKFLALIDDSDKGDNIPLIKEIRWRIENRHWLKHSHKIAFAILKSLDDKGMTQFDLAEVLEINPENVAIWVRGRENFTLQTISKIEIALGVRLL